jgi:hypothetical protein
MTKQKRADAMIDSTTDALRKPERGRKIKNNSQVDKETTTIQHLSSKFACTHYPRPDRPQHLLRTEAQR